MDTSTLVISSINLMKLVICASRLANIIVTMLFVVQLARTGRARMTGALTLLTSLVLLFVPVPVCVVIWALA